MSETSTMKLFSLNSNHDLAAAIAAKLGIPLGKAAIRQFSDGEIQINIEESVRGDDVYLLQATYNPVNTYLMELLIMIDSLKRASVRTINVVMPYYGYARQDRTAKPREPITAKLVANMLQKAGATRVLTLDLHTVQVQGFFDIPVDNLFVTPLFAKYFLKQGCLGENYVVVSPKNSGVNRARSLAGYLNSPLAIVDQGEDAQGTFEHVIGDVRGKHVIFVDDMINTGSTLVKAAKAVKEAGASDLYAAISHGLFVKEAAANREGLSLFKEIVVTDSVLPQVEIEQVQTISVASLMAKAIHRIDQNQPVSPLFK